MKNTKPYLWCLLAIALGTLYACQHEPILPDPNEIDDAPYALVVPAGFPMPDIPPDNALTNVRVAMGKLLFFDPILSRDATISCASCHFPDRAFSDTIAISPGVEQRLGVRNAMPLFNVAYHPNLMREGGVPTLEMQVLAPVSDHFEMDFNLVDAAERLAQDPNYADLSQRAYGRPPDPYVITRALAAFERVLLSGNSAYDRYNNGQSNALSPQALQGSALFQSLGCDRCHSGFNFTNYGYENNGLYAVYLDYGRQRMTGKDEDIGKFKVPSLRNVALTAPYMHDGSVATLSAVIDHYAHGLQNHPNQSPLLQTFDISETEKAALIAFLESLTDWEFSQNPAFRP